MSKILELLHQGRREELWQMCCGFIDLSLEQFMSIQKRLLLEQIELLKNCELGRKVMRGTMPETVEEFREQVPLTTYHDYCPELLEKREEVLPAKPARWVRTSGHSDEYSAKWVPISEGFWSEYVIVGGTIALLAFCRGRGDVSRLKEHMKVLFALGPPDYASGASGEIFQEALGIQFLPSNIEGGMSFQEKIKAGFAEALYKGIDAFGGLPSVLVAVGEQFKQGSGKIDINFLLSHPVALLRITKGLVKSKLARRPMLPKDLWTIKGIVGGGTDTAIFKARVKELWGKYPFEAYVGTEGAIYAIQAWDYGGMIFIPTLNFFEFIPEDEHFKWRLDRSYQPKTVLLDGVKAGEVYEMVVTNLHGGIITRYRLGDMVRVISLRNEKLNIGLPQIVFERRADELIDITGFGRLTEKIVWQAVENTNIPYADWTARKETINDKPMLHIYIELKDNYVASEKGVATAVYNELLKLDDEYSYNIYRAYGDPETVLGVKPVEVTLLARGAFERYIAQRQTEGAPLGHLKPVHINPSDKVLSLLRAKVKAVPEVEVAVEVKAEAAVRQ
ncbi:MAG: GH3 auxin-responsive promoter family protein [Dehalococcoidia bacterium]|nr:GH3 auxin-responsive promoter family protein [Dehalococcoidia bacterium]